MYCPYCKAEISDDSSSCSKCDKNLVLIKNESEYTCSQCGNDIPVDALYCWKCGEAFELSDDQVSKVQTKIYIPPPSRSLRANKKIVDENVCKTCTNHFIIGEEILLCEGCQSYYHKTCWENVGGCNQTTCKEELKLCPFCGKEIKSSALKCRHCGQYIDTYLKNKHVAKGKLKEASEALGYAIFGIFCFGIVLGPIAISKGNSALKIIDNEPGWEGRGKAKAAVILGWIVIVLWVLGLISRFAG